MKNLIRPEEHSEIIFALRRAFKKSKFWKKRFTDFGIKEEDINEKFNFQNIPLLDKKTIIKDQMEFPPYGSILSCNPSEILRVHKTSGTTSAPFLIFLTANDIKDTISTATKTFIAAGLNDTDRIVHCLNFNMWSGGVTDYLSLEKTGATSIPFGSGNTAALIDIIQKLKVNAISCTPSYMFKIKEKCEQLGLDIKDLGLKKGFFGGENLLQISDIRNKIEKDFGISAIDANYGLSEVLSIIGGEDHNKNGLIYNAHGMLYAELLDENLQSVEIKKGAVGEFVFSSLRREAQPLFRYRTNDVIEVLDAFYDEDDLIRIRFKIQGRSDEMFNVKGVNFFPESLASILNEIEPNLSLKYKVKKLSYNKDMDFKPEVLIEKIYDDANLEKYKDIETKFKSIVKQKINISIKLKWVEKNYFEKQGLNKINFTI